MKLERERKKKLRDDGETQHTTHNDARYALDNGQ